VGTLLQHNCSELGVSFLTARRSCEFCELPVATDPLQHHAGDRMSCESCGAELVAPYRFCKKCGKQQLQFEPDDSERELDYEETTDPDPLPDRNREFSTGATGESFAEAEANHTPYRDFSATPSIPKRRAPQLIGAAAALLSLGILVVVAVTYPKVRKTGPSILKPQTQAPPGMVYIPGGEFVMGNNAGDEYERPAHKVKVAPFYMDITEVTCEEYLKFLRTTGHKNPRNWSMETCTAAAARQPVTGVDWNDAKAYADWKDKRLPTEEEWEFAAHGVGGATYPWGNEWRANAANAGDSSAQRLMDVGSYPDGKTSDGLLDIIGNAWEWTSSDVVIYPGGSLSSQIPPTVKVIRGGSWRQSNQEATATYRGYLHITDAEDYSATGFRCAKSVGPIPVANKP
jgi:formylglycine-generating enzyme required for sulfatase activity